jgi:hypothetical protein
LDAEDVSLSISAGCARYAQNIEERNNVQNILTTTIYELIKFIVNVFYVL